MRGRPPKLASERFWSKVDKNGPIVKPELGPCWIWTGWKDYHGYGKFSVGDSTQRGLDVPSHRFAYETLVGPIPAGLELDHLCRNHACVNPKHLEPVTHKVNAKRGDAGKAGKKNASHLIATARAKTHCPKGHPYDLINTWYDKHGHRLCRICLRESQRQYRKNKRL